MKTLNTLFIFLIIAACSNNKMKIGPFKNVISSELSKTLNNANVITNNPTEISINYLKDEQELLLSEVIDSIWYVKLDNSPKALLGAIDKVVIKDSFVYLLDRTKTKSLKKFSLNGKFYVNIGHRGRGPGEFIEPTHFQCLNKHIIIYDQFTQNLLYYNYEGVFIKSKKVPFTFNTFYAFDDNTFLFQFFDNDNLHFPEILGYSLVWSDSTFNVKFRGLHQPHNKYIPFLSTGLVKSEGQLYFNRSFSDTIYQVSPNGKLNPEYIINLNSYKTPKEFFLLENKKEFDKGNYTMIGDFIKTNDFLYFDIYKNTSVYRFFYSLNTKKLQGFNVQLNDIKRFFPLSSLLTSYNNTLIGYVSPFSIKQNYSLIKTSNHEKAKELLETLKEFDNISINDNLFLAFYRLKSW